MSDLLIFAEKMAYWIIVGISGVTCGGKTTLSKNIFNYLTNSQTFLNEKVHIKTVSLVNQDDYFYPEDSCFHTPLENLKHINWEIMSALNMNQMCDDIKKILGPTFQLYSKDKNETHHPVYVNILIIEGFIIFNHPFLFELCQLKFHLHLPYEKCFQRRSVRVYDPPDTIGYFESCVWPMYIKHFNEFKNKDDDNMVILNGELSKEKCLNYVLNCIKNTL